MRRSLPCDGNLSAACLFLQGAKKKPPPGLEPPPTSNPKSTCSPMMSKCFFAERAPRSIPNRTRWNRRSHALKASLPFRRPRSRCPIPLFPRYPDRFSPVTRLPLFPLKGVQKTIHPKIRNHKKEAPVSPVSTGEPELPLFPGKPPGFSKGHRRQAASSLIAGVKVTP